MTTVFVAMEKMWSMTAILGHASMVSMTPTASCVRKMRLYKTGFHTKIPKYP